MEYYSKLLSWDWWTNASDEEVIDVIKNTKSVNIGSKRDIPPLGMACSALRSYEIIESLIERGADVNFQDFRGEIPLLSILYRNDGNSFGKIKLLVENGADVNYVHRPGNFSVLNYSCRHYDEEIVQYIIEHGADMDFVDKDGYDIITHLESNELITPEFIDKIKLRKIFR